MDNFDFEVSKEEWSCLPVDDIGYISAKQILSLSKTEAKHLMHIFQRNRYKTSGWRNKDNLWRSTLGLDTTKGKTIFDFGSGFAVEALQFLKLGNEVILADICEQNLKAAEYLLNSCGYAPKEITLIDYDEPYINPKSDFDIFYSCGAIHHTPRIKQILNKALCFFKGKAEYRLLLYSDISWENRAGTKIDYDTPIYKQAGFNKFVKEMDSVGKYADWYDKRKLETVIPENTFVSEFNYICKTKEYVTCKIMGK